MIPSTDDVEEIFQRGRALLVGDEGGVGMGSTLTVAVVRRFKAGLIVRFEEIGDRNVAEQFRGRTLLIGAKDARPLASDEYYLHDLVGLEVSTAAGEVVGRVAEVYEIGPGYCLGVDDGERERLIPFSRQIVREVDLAAGRIVIDPTPGLLAL